jgi:hypothetical protein
MTTDSEESRQVVTDMESDVEHIFRPRASANEFISQPLPPLPSQKDDERLFKQLRTLGKIRRSLLLGNQQHLLTMIPLMSQVQGPLQMNHP